MDYADVKFPDKQVPLYTSHTAFQAFRKTGHKSWTGSAQPITIYAIGTEGQTAVFLSQPEWNHKQHAI